MLYPSELQLINTEHSMEAYAVHQSFSGFNTTELGRLHSAQLSLVVCQLALTCDGSPLFAICILHHFSPDTSQPSSRGSTMLLHSMR